MSKILTANFSAYEFRNLGEKKINEIQDFLDLFDDFFILCEGEKGTATGLLSTCPPGKDVKSDKILTGIYSNNVLIGIIDLIKDYPEDGVWTIGYLLIHPAYRNQKIGSNIIRSFSQQPDIKALRCVVQAQNPRALNFWENHGFKIKHIRKEVLENIASEVFILEKEV